LEAPIDKLRRMLLNPLPGETAQYRMAPRHRLQSVQQADLSKFRESAVMILMCEEDGKLFIPLIQRPEYTGAHSAQVSFPGGKVDATDVNHAATALRECAEEIGVTEVEMLGALSPLAIPISGFMVYPFVGKCLVSPPAFIPHEREVARILRLDLQQLLKDEGIHHGSIRISDQLSIESAWYEVEGQQVWGATAMILSEFQEILKATF
jgi:8-oxo-dGTP pyrophosphatase MutT (NUDIX family)